MDDFNDRNVRFISKLVELTQRGRIHWASHPQGGYVTDAFGRRLRTLEASRPNQLGIVVPVSTPVLEVLDEAGKVGYSFEGVTGLRDLFSHAAYHATRVEDLIDDVLAS